MAARDDYPNLASIAAASPTARPAAVYSWTREQITEALDEIDRLRAFVNRLLEGSDL